MTLVNVVPIGAELMEVVVLKRGSESRTFEISETLQKSDFDCLRKVWKTSVLA